MALTDVLIGSSEIATNLYTTDDDADTCDELANFPQMATQKLISSSSQLSLQLI